MRARRSFASHTPSPPLLQSSEDRRRLYALAFVTGFGSSSSVGGDGDSCVKAESSGLFVVPSFFSVYVCVWIFYEHEHATGSLCREKSRRRGFL